MKLHIIFGQRVCSYEGEHAPEVLDCWDEYSFEANPEGFDQAVRKAQNRTAGPSPEFSSVAVIDVTIDGDAVDRRLNQNLKLKGTIEAP